ncbi:uncharacterized protein DS421_17g588600 [Arachis hypogaea]|nr:uncharacterized protein DS421_17g588600 [Arachis hypogaea]
MGCSAAEGHVTVVEATSVTVAGGVPCITVAIVSGVVGAAVAGERASTNLRRERERYDAIEDDGEVFCHCSHVSSPPLPSMEVVAVAEPLHRRTSSLEDQMEKLASLLLPLVSGIREDTTATAGTVIVGLALLWLHSESLSSLFG